MTTKSLLRWFPALLMLLCMSGVRADVPFDLLAATPPGSWQRQESVSTDDAGRQVLAVIETALLAEEQRNGVDFVWVQTEIQPYRLTTAGEREPYGDRTVMQTLLQRRVLAAGTFGGLDNLRRFGSEVIYQVGEATPMRVVGAGQIAATIAGLTGANTTPVLTPLGSESLKTAAGRFDTTRLGSQFRSQGQLLGQSLSVDVQGSVWLSPVVPFGLVQSHSTEVTNGIASSTRTELVAYGSAGAVSKISGAPTHFEIPAELRGLFGGLQGWFGGG
ncbi:MAG: hypothetical protein ACNA7W_20135 [Pseudomonadales bacterium]